MTTLALHQMPIQFVKRKVALAQPTHLILKLTHFLFFGSYQVKHHTLKLFLVVLGHFAAIYFLESCQQEKP